MAPAPDPDGALDALLELHAQVDADAARLAQRHAARLVCKRGCAACCLDDLTVLEVEAERIRRNRREVLDQAPHPRGACAFLDAQGACRIYADRPYVCRTQGLPLQAFHEDGDGEIVEQRDICGLNAEGEPLAELGMDEVWTIGPTELRLVQIQERYAGGGARRVPLRALFRR